MGVGIWLFLEVCSKLCHRSLFAVVIFLGVDSYNQYCRLKNKIIFKISTQIILEYYNELEHNGEAER